MRDTTDQKMKELHRAMLQYQKSIAPFTPTVRELCGVFKTPSTSHCLFYLKKMVARGMVITHRAGSSARYYAVEQAAE